MKFGLRATGPANKATGSRQRCAREHVNFSFNSHRKSCKPKKKTKCILQGRILRWNKKKNEINKMIKRQKWSIVLLFIEQAFYKRLHSYICGSTTHNIGSCHNVFSRARIMTDKIVDITAWIVDKILENKEWHVSFIQTITCTGSNLLLEKEWDVCN